MTNNRFLKIFIALLCLIHLSVFVGFYTTTYLPSVRLLEVKQWVVDAVYYLTSLIEYCLPLICATVALCIGGGSIKKSVICSVLISIPRFVYLFPYYYLYQIAYGYDSLESLGLSALISLGLVALLAVHILILYFTAYFVMRLLTKKAVTESLPPYKKNSQDKRDKAEILEKTELALPERIRDGGVIDLSVPVLLGIFAAALLDFLYPFISECISAVSFLITFAGTQTPEEILFMGLSFLYILAKLLLSYFLAVAVKSVATKTKDAEITKE